MNKACIKFKGLIPLGVSDDINDAEMDLLRAHLAECAECQKEFAGYQELKKSAGQIGDIKPQVGGDFWAAQRNKIIQAVNAQPVYAGPFSAVLFRYAAMFLAGIIGGAVLWQWVKPCPPQTGNGLLSAQPRAVNILGAELSPITKPVANHLGINPGNGLIVSVLPHSSPAQRLGLKMGDIVIEVNGHVVTSTVPGGLTGSPDIKIIRNGNVIIIRNK
ncbi:MAG: zf-HC2 domain-containing protein [Planctomycetota bacterium]